MYGTKLSVIGGGNMAAALVQGILKAGLYKKEGICIAEPLAARREYWAKQGIQTQAENKPAGEFGDVLLIAVKPKYLAQALDELALSESANKLVISIVAGASTPVIERHLPEQSRIFCVMPNTPALTGQGMSVISGDYTGDEKDLKTVTDILATVGEVSVLDASLMSAVTGVSGSGPAYAYMLVEAMALAGVRAGLPLPDAQKLAAQTVLGAAKMVLETGESPAVLRDKVCSPAGTTIEGVKALHENGFYQAVMEAVSASALRAAEIAKTLE